MRKMGLSGFRFLPEALSLDPDFCLLADSSISFLSNGCVEWVGPNTRWFSTPVEFVRMPVTHAQSFPYHLHMRILIYTSGMTGINWWKEKVVMECGNPMCVNPDHMGFCKKSLPYPYIYPDYVEEDMVRPREWFFYYAVHVSWKKAFCFQHYSHLCQFLKVSGLALRNYFINGRPFQGQWLVSKEKIKNNRRDWEMYWDREVYQPWELVWNGMS